MIFEFENSQNLFSCGLPFGWCNFQIFSTLFINQHLKYPPQYKLTIQLNYNWLPRVTVSFDFMEECQIQKYKHMRWHCMKNVFRKQEVIQLRGFESISSSNLLLLLAAFQGNGVLVVIPNNGFFFPSWDWWKA